MADLLQAMHLSKSSLYQSFGSKAQLFQRCINRYADWLLADLRMQLAQAVSGRSFIQTLFANVANTAERPEGAKGCLMVNSVVEFGQRDSAVASALEGSMQPLTALFVEAIQHAKRDGEIGQDADVMALANYVHVALGGLRTMIKAGMDKKTALELVPLILKVLD